MIYFLCCILYIFGGGSTSTHSLKLDPYPCVWTMYTFSWSLSMSWVDWFLIVHCFYYNFNYRMQCYCGWLYLDAMDLFLWKKKSIEDQSFFMSDLLLLQNMVRLGPALYGYLLFNVEGAVHLEIRSLLKCCMCMSSFHTI